ncbi:NAD(P)(+) transhydrogenase (Re/Si-specific) subunit beta, partial [Rhodothermus marinus]|uniref:NAD(P)(+) transhydrogenase (Re/Si-specific) subunit beta n=1 Tax=Rhodothermus marinus TaxID=29549 RepID=UPI00396E95FF
MKTTLIDLTYLIAAALFIFGLKRLQSPQTARTGNQLAAFGMLLAVVATLFLHKIVTPVEMIAGLVIGGAIGAVLARRVEMTAMPELVAAFNGFGGLASALVATAEVARYLIPENSGMALAALLPAVEQVPFDVVQAITIVLSVLIGLVTFSGSFVAFGKLGGYITGNPVIFPGMRLLTLLVALGSLVSIGFVVAGADAFPTVADPVVWGVVVLSGLSLVLGVLLVIPIGGADMPVVVSLLNSYSGLAAAATGFVLDNTALIVSGALVGASGLILTRIMCEAMNRSLLNVLLGGFGGEAGDGAAVASAEGKTVHEATLEDAAILLAYANKVI